METLMSSGAVKLPIKCTQCPLEFSNPETLKIHSKNCLGNETSHTRNTLSCPLCSREFRTMSNLARHEETKKHLDLLNWYRENYAEEYQDDQEDTEEHSPKENQECSQRLETVDQVKEYAREISKKLNIDSFEEYNDSEPISEDFNNKFDTEIDTDNDEYPEMDDFLSELEETRVQESFAKPKIETKVGTNVETKPAKNQIEKQPENNFDDFLSSLEKDREDQLKTTHQAEIKDFLQPPPKTTLDQQFQQDQIITPKQQFQRQFQQDPIIAQKTNIINRIANTSVEIGFDDQDDILNEIKYARELIKKEEKEREIKLQELENKQEVGLIDQVNNYLQRQINERRMIDERGINFSHTSSPNGNIVGNPEINDKNKNKIDLESRFKHHPLWSLMVKLCQEKTISGRFANILISSPIIDYPIIYYFVRFSSYLKGKKERPLKIQLVKIFIDFETVLVQSFQKKQMVVAGKDVRKLLILFKTWNLSSLMQKLKE